MWPFQRKPLPVVTNEAYSRWLRAGRPPWLWFLNLSELEQEQCALIGDGHNQDLAVAIGYAVMDPQVADAGLAAAAGDPAGDETLARRVAADLMQRILAREKGPVASRSEPEAPSMGGITKRREAAAQARQQAKDAGRSFLGRRPDPVEVAE